MSGRSRALLALCLPILLLAIWPISSAVAGIWLPGPYVPLKKKLSATKGPDGSVTARVKFKSREPACVAGALSGRITAEVSFDLPGALLGYPFPIQQKTGTEFPLAPLSPSVLQTVLPPTHPVPYEYDGSPYEIRTAPVSQAIRALVATYPATRKTRKGFRVKSAKTKGMVTCNGIGKASIFPGRTESWPNI